MSDVQRPPQAPKRPTTLTQNGDERVDDWYWLRDKDDPAVLAHLEAENAYTTHMMRGTQSAQQHLFDEMVARIQETDLSVPVRKGAWWYYSRTEEGKQYGIHCRRADVDGTIAPEDQEQVLLDENTVAGDSEYFSLGAFDISPDGRRLAYSTDFDGDEVFTLHVRDLETGIDLPDTVEHTHYSTAWSKDGTVVLYTRPDSAMRPFQVWRHHIGTDATTDELVFQEDDERFFVGVGNTKTDEFIIIDADSSLTNEVRVLPSDDPTGTFAVVEPRRHDVKYELSHHNSERGNRFYVLTNDGAPNYKLMVTDVGHPAAANWQEVVAHRSDVKLDGIEEFRDHLVLSERAEATARLSVLDLSTGNIDVLDQPETVYTTRATGNAEFDTAVLRFNYTSLVTPNTVFEVDLRSGVRTQLKQQPVLGGYDPDEYATERTWATASDGTRVPISLVYRKDRRRDEPGPALLYGYGSYEISIDPGFSSLRLSLLDRGFVFAIAHIRGGGDMGRLWYEHGKFLEKKNTFTDFIACAEHLIAEGYTEPSQLVIRGGSAGGLLMGAVTNARPDLFAGVVAEVPFVDALTTMLDASLPLTVHEYEEWGNPQDPEYYEYMRSYSPYDNVHDATYPTILATGGLNDPRVGFWEPAKWVQKLREHSADPERILLKMEMGAGHGGPSGRYDSWRDEAFVFAFVFQALDIRLRF